MDATIELTTRAGQTIRLTEAEAREMLVKLRAMLGESQPTIIVNPTPVYAPYIQPVYCPQISWSSPLDIYCSGGIKYEITSSKGAASDGGAV